MLWATTWIGYFRADLHHGFGAITLGLTATGVCRHRQSVIKGGQWAATSAAVLVAKAVGGDVFFGFISAVAFATILAVVAGLTLSGASAVSHDIYATVMKGGKGRQRLGWCRASPPSPWCIAVVLGIAFESRTLPSWCRWPLPLPRRPTSPCCFMSVLWKTATTRAPSSGGFLGLISSVALTVVSPSVWEATLGNPKARPWFQPPRPRCSQ